ncbi:MAG: hypothetical protein JWN56_866 [Sphingobacteriales bacterium]|nr:hypothetical protein [Sphingobacteriales bacterium]
MTVRFSLLLLLIQVVIINPVKAKDPSSLILGKWISEEKNVIVKVYKEGDKFNVKILWFDDTDDKTKPLLVRTDEHNPDKELRNRKILGLEVLHDLTYNAKTNEWENGKIYDASTGREWDACLYFSKKQSLTVKGYWHVKFLCRTLTFFRHE